MLDTLAPDIAVLQECARPTTETDQCLWFGDNPLQGVAVLANGLYRIRALAAAAEVPPYSIPVEVTGPKNFLLIAVWAKVRSPYVKGVIRAVEIYRSLFTQYRTVLAGDLNSNAIWDSSNPVDHNHSVLVEMLSELGLVSSYHFFFREAQGHEKRFTQYFRWNEQKPYHIDYCFIPKEWAPAVPRVEIGSHAEWKDYSDHRPLLVEVAEHATTITA